MAGEKERQVLLALYNFPAWKRKVNQMTDAQVIAIYLSAKRRGKV